MGKDTGQVDKLIQLLVQFVQFIWKGRGSFGVIIHRKSARDRIGDCCHGAQGQDTNQVNILKKSV